MKRIWNGVFSSLFHCSYSVYYWISCYWLQGVPNKTPQKVRTLCITETECDNLLKKKPNIFVDLVDDVDNVDFVDLQLSNCYCVYAVYFVYVPFSYRCLPCIYPWPSWRWDPCQWSPLQGLFLCLMRFLWSTPTSLTSRGCHLNLKCTCGLCATFRHFNG